MLVHVLSGKGEATTVRKGGNTWRRFQRCRSCEKVPVEAILEEFHKLSGARGRNAHRGQAPPQYNFTVKEEAGSSGV